MNPLYNQLNQMSGGNDLISRFMQFKNTFKGNPQEQIQRMLNSGQVSQAQYNDAVQKANQLAQMLNMK